MNIDWELIGSYAGMVPVLVVLVQIVKRIRGVPTWALPLVSIGLGLLLTGAAMLAFPPEGFTGGQKLGVWLLAGIVTGLSASGLYSATKETVLAVKGEGK